MKTIWIEVTSWAGMSIGATHTYGRLVSSDGLNEKLTRPITRAEAKAENNESYENYGFSAHRKPGDLTEGFIDEGAVIEAGKRRAAELCPDGEYLLVLGDHCSASAWSRVLYAPGRFSRVVREINQLCDSFAAIGGYDKRRDKEADAIDSRFLLKMREIDPYYFNTPSRA